MKRGIDRNQAKSLRGYGTLACETCELEVIEPLPQTDELLDIYTDGYRLHTGSTSRRPSPSARTRSQVRRMVLLLHRLRYGDLASDGRQPAGRVLEIGFGSGERLEGLFRLGWDVAGLEVAASPAQSILARIPSGDFRVGSLENTEYPEASFDLILMYHVLEHLDDPESALRKLPRLLRPNGRVVVAFPNRESITRSMFGPYWYGYQHPEHLVQYSERSMRAVAGQCGLAVARARPQSYFHALGDSYGNIVDPSWQHLFRRRAVKFAMFPLGLLLVLLGDAAALEVELERAS